MNLAKRSGKWMGGKRCCRWAIHGNDYSPNKHTESQAGSQVHAEHLSYALHPCELIGYQACVNGFWGAIAGVGGGLGALDVVRLGEGKRAQDGDASTQNGNRRATKDAPVGG